MLACYECEPVKGSEPSVIDHVRWVDVNEIDFRSTLAGTQDFISLALRNDWFDKLFIDFQQGGPDANARKHDDMKATLVELFKTVRKEAPSLFFDFVIAKLPDGSKMVRKTENGPHNET